MADVLSFDLTLTLDRFQMRAKAAIPLDGITVISGPSGSGKTTLLRALAGLEPSVTGPVRFRGTDWTGLAAHQRRIGFVFQDARLFSHMSVEANIRYGAQRRGATGVQVNAIIEAMDLGPLLMRRTQSLSGGESRRVALARALAALPEMLFLDEPMVGLDPARRAEVLPYITRAADEFGMAVLYVSHSQFERALLADREFRMEAGLLGSMRDGPPRFHLPIFGAEDGRVAFEADGTRFTLPGQGPLGQSWEIRPGHGCILATDHPGAHSAGAVLPVRLISTAGRTCTIQLAGQSLVLGLESPFAANAARWLICPRLRGRPRSTD